MVIKEGPIIVQYILSFALKLLIPEQTPVNNHAPLHELRIIYNKCTYVWPSKIQAYNDISGVIGESLIKCHRLSIRNMRV